MKIFNLLLTVGLMVAYFGYNEKVLSYGGLLILLFIGELFDLIGNKND